MPNPLYDALLAPLAGDDAPFIYDGDKVLTFDGFYRQVAQAAQVLADEGLRPGDRLALQVEKSCTALAIYGACLMSGVIFLPLNTAYTPKEIDYFLSDATPGLLVCDLRAQDALRPTAQTLGTTILTLDLHGNGTFSTAMNKMPARFDPVDRAPDDIAALLYTSGTTGRSKGAMLTQNNLLSNAQVLCDLWQITSEDRLLHALPIFHAHGLFVAFNTSLLAKARIIFLPRFDADAVIEALPRANTMMGVPTFYTRLLDDNRFTADLVRDFRLFVSGSAPLLASTHEAFEERTGHRILERYGMTETSMNASNPFDGERRAGTVGFPLAGTEIRITDGSDGKEVKQGDIGMVEVRGPNVFQGYWNMPDKTREELRGNGYFITGDLGRFDEDGYLHIVGRNKDMVITGGYNVYPKEIELLLDAFDWVRESAVFGIAHPDYGEAVVAAIVPNDTTKTDEAGLRAALAADVAKYKQPKAYFIVDTLPRNTMGKVQKNVLRDDFAGHFTAASSSTA